MPGIFDSLAGELNNNPQMDDEDDDQPVDMLSEEEEHECPMCKHSAADASVIDKMKPDGIKFNRDGIIGRNISYSSTIV